MERVWEYSAQRDAFWFDGDKLCVPSRVVQNTLADCMISCAQPVSVNQALMFRQYLVVHMGLNRIDVKNRKLGHLLGINVHCCTFCFLGASF